jgi:RNA polymerase sigma factor (sigma-70 family)
MPAPILKLLAAAPVGATTCDAELLDRFLRTRDEVAFGELVRRHGPLVYRVCSRLLSHDLADDAFQAVFIVLACRADRLRKPGSVGSWLVGVAGRVARQLRAREALRAAKELPEVADRSHPPEAHLLGMELAQLLDNELTRLPDDLRDAVVLCLLQGRSQDEAASELGGSVRTLRRRLNRAKAILRVRLQRRGMVPAVAAGLVSGGMAGARAVPPELIRMTVAAVGEFLNGNAAQAAPVGIAKEVVENMVTMKHWCVSACVVILGLGLVWAATAQSSSDPGLPSPDGGRSADPTQSRPKAQERDPKKLKERPPASHRTANFVVYAPTPVVARIVAGEAEYQREQIARLWLGKALPNWPNRAVIIVTFSWGSGFGSTKLAFADAKTVPPAADIEMTLDGFTLESLEGTLPREIAETILATHFGKPVPRWAGGGIGRLHEPDAEQAGHDTLTRQLLNEGRGIRLKALFRMTEFPQDMTLLNAQSHSVCRFLLAEGQTRAALLGFVGNAMKDNSAEGWDRAAKTLGFESVEALEKTWLEWLAKPESKFKVDGLPTVKPPDDQFDRIPPAKLPGGAPPPGRP